MTRFQLVVATTLTGALTPSTGLASPDDLTAAEIQEWLAEQTVEVSFLVTGSFANYGSAFAFVDRVHRRTGIDVNLRGFIPHDNGLSWSREVCEEWAGFPCYLPRGRFDAGTYLSIEKSDSFKGMKPGFFVVMAASGNRTDVEPVKRDLARAGVRGYVRTVPVYMGCIH